MKQKDKDLILKDICARLPYDVKCKILETNEIKILSSVRHDWENTLFDFWEDERKIQYDYQLYLSEFKPYLFPLSSITEEQKKEFPGEVSILNSFIDGSIYLFEDEELTPEDIIELFDFLNKNHFDYRGLIENGLAIDATGKNIY
jgi:hypothetical protein